MFFRSKKENGKGTPSPAQAKPGKSAAVSAALSKSSGAMAAIPAVAPSPGALKPLPPEELKKRAEASQRLAATVGEIVGLMLRSPRHRDHKLSDLRWLALPAIRAGQYALTSAQSKSHGYTAAVAAVLWARVSAEVDKRLSENLDTPIHLAPGEWKSGDILWLVEAIGDDRVISAIIKRLQADEWKGKAVKARVADAKGQVKIRLIDAQTAVNGSAAGRK